MLFHDIAAGTSSVVTTINPLWVGLGRRVTGKEEQARMAGRHTREQVHRPNPLLPAPPPAPGYHCGCC
jgi:hypothetical protein